MAYSCRGNLHSFLFKVENIRGFFSISDRIRVTVKGWPTRCCCLVALCMWDCFECVCLFFYLSFTQQFGVFHFALVEAQQLVVESRWNSL